MTSHYVNVIKIAFLQGYLTKKVFIEQPLNFIDLNCLSHVCCFIKAIYHRLYSFLFYYRFINNRSDPLLFIHYTSTSIMILLVYIDDLVVTGFHVLVIIDHASTLCFIFACRD